MAKAALVVDVLRQRFGDAVQTNIALAPYTSARIGGPADVLLTVKSADELADAMQLIWQQELPYYILGGGSNVLVSDEGFRGVVVLDRAKETVFEMGDQPTVWCEAGVVIANLAKRCASKGLAGLEWSATVPGTVGGAVYGNAGAFGGEMNDSLLWADVLTQHGREKLTLDQMGYGYRTSVLKRGEIKGIVLSALLKLKNSSKEEVSVKIEQFSERRKATQPPGASMGSMFKNPEGDYAGRLIEAAGLKGMRIGSAEISSVHGNFFINHGDTKADDIRALISLVQKTVFEMFNVKLELEVELVGTW
ncbi:MAG: UDP-N-acetylmuramate dehydrogenase [Anaerolineales bacterium]|nr:UDP-N-acetylmuramate dehydrogenase [Anaerolineales bacterium]MCB9144645.1 UDP-N-acetylmuramate dehydrogenase [Anaerolineales bacterium]